MNNQIILASFTLSEFQQVISDTVSELLKSHSQPAPTADEPLLKSEDACKLLNISQVTLFNWKSQGLIPYHKMKSRVYYKRIELIESLKRINLKQGI